MIDCEFVGGSKDGAVFGIPEAMNTTIRFPIPDDCAIPDLATERPLAIKRIASEIYRYSPIDHRYYFVGYD